FPGVTSVPCRAQPAVEASISDAASTTRTQRDAILQEGAASGSTGAASVMRATLLRHGCSLPGAGATAQNQLVGLSFSPSHSTPSEVAWPTSPMKSDTASTPSPITSVTVSTTSPAPSAI